jgi:FdhD protein
MRGTKTIDVERASGGGREKARDEVVMEEPLEIRIAGDTIAVTMRTPGHDRELVLGFLWAEGIIGSLEDVSSIAPCGRTGDEGRENTLEVTLAPGVKVPVDDQGALARRGTITTSACGVCGRRSIDDLLARFRELPDGPSMPLTSLHRAIAALRDRQPLFAKTGGLHAAGLAALDGTLLAAFEDVGRHNAVDKLVGAHLAKRALPLSESALIVSGRASFEIVQKAIAAGIPIVASVSAASSLAVDLAARANVTLVGFVRDGSTTIYTGAARAT